MIRDLKDCFIKILKYTNGLTYNQFINNGEKVDAVIRNFEIIGEASKLLTEEFKSNNHHVEWRLLTDFRNRLIHEYFGIDYSAVWEIIQHEAQHHLDLLEKIDIEEQKKFL